jgi:hypothetical protein
VNTPTITPDGSSATITWTTPNMNPGSAYHAQFLVGDIGSLPGEMSQVTYAPPSSLSSSQSSLLSSMTVTVSEMVPGSGHWTQLPGGGSASGRHTFTTAPAISGLKPRGTQIGFMVTYTLSKSATNTSENATVTPTLNFVGTTMPS